ncbi:putative transmembrane protein [Toxoplasma gondii MAS]|uniref:Putative transmembrane protein n=1 Tax=Toxoplasma gondii MAS TaxID=943118 RepID=A0A086QD17_TOXGO|nr:putative transmembrane protein [Toxoplasma gondii MAS]
MLNTNRAVCAGVAHLRMFICKFVSVHSHSHLCVFLSRRVRMTDQSDANSAQFSRLYLQLDLLSPLGLHLAICDPRNLTGCLFLACRCVSAPASCVYMQIGSPIHTHINMYTNIYIHTYIYIYIYIYVYVYIGSSSLAVFRLLVGAIGATAVFSSSSRLCCTGAFVVYALARRLPILSLCGCLPLLLPSPSSRL